MTQTFIIFITSHVMVSLMVVWLTETCQCVNKGVWLNFSDFYLKHLHKTFKQLPEEATAHPLIKLAVSYWIYYTETDLEG
jgi:hypothetical protein